MSDLDPSGASGAAPPLKRSTLPLPVAAPAARGADSSETAAPTAGTLAVAAAVAAGSDWIWVSDPSPASFGSPNTDEAEACISMAPICSDTPVATTGSLAVSRSLSTLPSNLQFFRCLRIKNTCNDGRY